MFVLISKKVVYLCFFFQGLPLSRIDCCSGCGAAPVRGPAETTPVDPAPGPTFLGRLLALIGGPAGGAMDPGWKDVIFRKYGG